jgi:hypothetical protein
MQLALGFIGLIIFVFVLFAFPETYHPGERGVDKADPSELPTWRPILLNPLRPLLLLRSPNLMAVVRSSIALVTTLKYNIQVVARGVCGAVDGLWCV